MSDNIKLRSIESQLTLMKEAAQRVRFAFVVMTIASSAILFTVWNNNFSRDRSMAFENPPSTPAASSGGRAEQPPAAGRESHKPLYEYGTEQLVSEWYKNRIIQVGLLGIRVSVSDIAMVGSFTLVVITIWFYFCQRRENRALVSLVTDVQGEEYELRNMVYQSIRHSLVLITIGESDEALSWKRGDLRKPDGARGPGEEERGAHDGAAAAPREEAEKRKTPADRILMILYFLPFWTVVAIIVTDLWRLGMVSPTSPTPNLTLGIGIWDAARENLGKIPNGFHPRAYLIATYPILMIMLFECVATGCAVYLWRLCKKCQRFIEASKESLREFEESLKQERESRQAPAGHTPQPSGADRK